MNEEHIKRQFVQYINKFFNTYTKSPFKENKDTDSQIKELIIKNKPNILEFFKNIMHLGKYLCFSTYNMDFDGIDKIKKISDDEIKIYSVKLFNNDRTQNIILEPESMHFIQEDADVSLTTVAIKAKKEGSGLEVLSAKLDSDELYIDGGHVLMIYPYCSGYAEPERKIRLMRDHFKLNLDEENLLYISDFYEPRAFSEKYFEEEFNSSTQKTKKISLESHLVKFFGEDFFVLPIPDKKLIQIMLSINEEEENINNAINKLHELYPDRLLYSEKKPSCQVIEIVNI